MYGYNESKKKIATRPAHRYRNIVFWCTSPSVLKKKKKIYSDYPKAIHGQARLIIFVPT